MGGGRRTRVDEDEDARRREGERATATRADEGEGEGEGEGADADTDARGQARGRTSEGIARRRRRRTFTRLQENIERYFLFLLFILVCRFWGSSLFAFYGIARSPVSSLDFSRHRSRVVTSDTSTLFFVRGAHCFVSDTRSDDITSSLLMNQFIHTRRTRFCGQKNCARARYISYVFTCLTYNFSAAKTLQE